MNPPLRERLVLLAASALFLHLVLFRDGTFVYQFHKASSGAWMDEAARVLDGETMYRDFVDTVGPGIVHLDALVLALFGRRLAVLAWAGLAMGCALGFALHALAGRVAAAPWRWLPPALMVVLVYPPFDFGHPRWPALLLGLLALLRLATPSVALPRALQAGLLLGGAGLFDPTTALPLLAGAFLYIVAFGRRGRGGAALALALGAALPLVAALSWLAARAGPRSVLQGWIVGPFARQLAEAGVTLGAHWGIRQAAFLTTALGSLTAGVMALTRFHRPSPAADDEAAGLPAVALPGLCLAVSSLAGQVDPYVLAVHALPLTPCLAFALGRAGGDRPLSRWTARAVLAVLALGLAHALVGMIVLRQWLQPLVRQRFRAGEAWIGAPNVELRWLESRTRPGDPVFVFPAGGASYFLTATRNVTPFPYAIEGRFDRERQREALAHIAAAAPAVGIWMGGQRRPPPAGVDDLGMLYEGILGSYRPVERLPDGTLLLERARGGVSE